MSGESIGTLVGSICVAESSFGSMAWTIIINAYVTANVAAMSDSVFRVACCCRMVNRVSLRLIKANDT